MTDRCTSKLSGEVNQMIEATGTILESVGALAGLFGFLWRLWNRKATGAFVMLLIGLVGLIIGGAITGDL